MGSTSLRGGICSHLENEPEKTIIWAGLIVWWLYELIKKNSLSATSCGFGNFRGELDTYKDISTASQTCLSKVNVNSSMLFFPLIILNSKTIVWSDRVTQMWINIEPLLLDEFLFPHTSSFLSTRLTIQYYKVKGKKREYLIDGLSTWKAAEDM